MRPEPDGESACTQGDPVHVLLRPLTEHDEAVARAAHVELAADNFSFLLEDPSLPWPQYVSMLDAVSRGEGLAPGRVRASFLVAEADGEIVGRVSIRYELNEWLARVGGHIGYGVRPAFRRRGYATEILRQALVLARASGVDLALVTCDEDNVASARTIEACGGVLEGTVTDLPHGPKRRYWVPTG
jgi:predicted acetyltransferase